MPEYTFQDATTGEEVLLFMGMADAVPIGETREIEGRTLLRMADMGGRPVVSKGVGHVSRALPRWTEGADSYTAAGEPIITGQADIDRIIKKNPGLNYGDDAIQRG